MTDTQAHICSMGIFLTQNTLFELSPQNKTFCFYYTLTLVSVCHSIRYILCMVYLNHVFDFLLFFGT